MNRYSQICLSMSMLLMFLISCKKDQTTPQPDPTLDPYIAPCTINESFYDLDSVYFGSNTWQTEAKFRVKFFDTLSTGQVNGQLEFFFNKIPTSGIYQMVAYIDTNNFNVPNQIAYVSDSGSFKVRSQVAESSQIYVENNSNEIVISWCSLPDTTYHFDAGTMCYVGNGPTRRKIRKSY